jgi:hypothetical protein
LPQYKFREELRNYFDEFKERVEIDGVIVRSYYFGFNANKYKAPSKDVKTFSLVMEETSSLFDREFADQPAQYATAGAFQPSIGQTNHLVNGEMQDPGPIRW